MQVDGGAAVRGQSRGRSMMVNTKGSIYLGEAPDGSSFSLLSRTSACLTARTSRSGGAPDTAAMTGGKFSAGLSGCVRNLILTNGEQPVQPVDLQAYAASGFNVQPCSS